jgi:uncharacterized protein (TIGR03435 family)
MITESTSGRWIRTRHAWLAAALAGATLASVSAAQTPAPASFEVATVKPNKSGEAFIRFGIQPGGRFTAQNVPLFELIRFAYSVQPFQIEGGPGWIRSDRFDVTAKAESDFGPVAPDKVGPLQMMMQSLLAERFNLKVRRETKEAPIYALVLARADGKLGPKLEVATVDCAALMRGRGAGPGGRGTPPPVLRPGEKPECGVYMLPSGMSGGGVSIDQLAQMLSTRVRRTVANKTGLTGNYGFTLEFTPDQMPPPGAQAPPGLPPIDPNGPSLFTALQEQLGLKLDSQRGPVETLVIESVSQPTAD